MKKKINKIIKWAGGLACIIMGLLIGAHGVKQFIPEKQYGGGDVSVKVVKKEEE